MEMENSQRASNKNSNRTTRKDSGKQCDFCADSRLRRVCSRKHHKVQLDVTAKMTDWSVTYIKVRILIMCGNAADS